MIKYFMLFGAFWYGIDIYHLVFNNQLPSKSSIFVVFFITIFVFFSTYVKILLEEKLTRKINGIMQDNSLTEQQKRDKIETILRNIAGGKK